MRHLFVVACVAASACMTPTDQGLSAAVAQAVRDSVAASMRQYEASVLALDVPRIATFYSTDPALRTVDGQHALTRQALFR